MSDVSACGKLFLRAVNCFCMRPTVFACGQLLLHSANLCCSITEAWFQLLLFFPKFLFPTSFSTVHRLILCSTVACCSCLYLRTFAVSDWPFATKASGFYVFQILGGKKKTFSFLSSARGSLCRLVPADQSAVLVVACCFK